MKYFIVAGTVVLVIFSMWVSWVVSGLLQSDPLLVLIGSLIILGIISVWVFTRKPSEPVNPDPRVWMNVEHEFTYTDGRGETWHRSADEHGNEFWEHGRRGVSVERIHTDSRGETWWKTEVNGKELWIHENHAKNIADNDELLRRL